MKTKKRKIDRFIFGGIFLSLGILLFFGYYLFFLKPVFVLRDWTTVGKFTETSPSLLPSNSAGRLSKEWEVKSSEEEIILPVHVATPDAVRAIYMTNCVAQSPRWREGLVDLVMDTELNSIVIDIKDYSGKISFKLDGSFFENNETSRCTVDDIEEFIKSLHEKDIYVIGRITVFQDPYYAVERPDLAVKRKNGSVWKDYKGISFIDIGAREFWDYIVALSRESYNIGFDELNYDYIRFPSDGNMSDAYYPFSGEIVKEDPELGKAKVVQGFFKYLDEGLSDTGVILSADLFGMATVNTDDLNIGQVLEYAEPYFDYISPMVYPSHYPTGFIGYSDVNAHPYAIVKYSMDKAAERLNAASSTPEKLRPWLQDFSWPVTYTSSMVRAQIQAVYDAGLDSWMLWSSSNTYTRSALESKLEK